MRTIELPEADGTILNFVDYELDLLLSPPAIKENINRKADEFVTIQNGKLRIEKNTSIDEGRLKISIFDLSSGKYFVYIYGKIKGKEINRIKEFHTVKTISASLKNVKIKYVLVYSRNILKNYYLSSDTTGIENHLTTFLAPI